MFKNDRDYSLGITYEEFMEDIDTDPFRGHVYDGFSLSDCTNDSSWTPVGRERPGKVSVYSLAIDDIHQRFVDDSGFLKTDQVFKHTNINYGLTCNVEKMRNRLVLSVNRDNKQLSNVTKLVAGLSALYSNTVFRVVPDSKREYQMLNGVVVN